MPSGLRAAPGQLALQLIQVLCVGATLGTTRTVVPALAESEFGVARGSFLMLATFVVVFGMDKALINFWAGTLSDRHGRRQVLVWGWLVALPIPVLLFFARDWWWLVAACGLLGVNQGLTWSASQLAKLDLAAPQERGLAVGLNESGGYLGVALAGWWTAELAAGFGARATLGVSALAIVVTALALAVFAVRDAPGSRAPAPAGGVGTAFARYSWRDPRMLALNQAGLVEKWVDALVWLFVPAYLFERGAALGDIGLIAGSYGAAWGFAQLATGPLSDRIGRDGLSVAGMVLCGGAIALMPWVDGIGAWAGCAGASGLGMAMLYPTLIASVADHAPLAERGAALGAYRFWRDLGYAVGAVAIAVAAELGGGHAAAFEMVGVAMLASGAWLAISRPRALSAREPA